MGATRQGKGTGYVPSFLLSLGVHGGFLAAVGLLLTVTGGPRHQSLEMDVVQATVAPPPPEPPPAPSAAEEAAPVRARRSPRAPRETAPPSTPTPTVDPGPPVPGASDQAMPAAPAPPPAGGTADGVLGGSHDPRAAGPGGQGTGSAPAPAPERRVYDMADLDAPPSLVGSCTAQVPAFARQTNQSGWVMLQFTLDPQGSVQAPRVRAGSPPGVFDQAALDAIRRCRYTPPRVGGRSVSVTFRQRLRFEP